MFSSFAAPPGVRAHCDGCPAVRAGPPPFWGANRAGSSLRREGYLAIGRMNKDHLKRELAARGLDAAGDHDELRGRLLDVCPGLALFPPVVGFRPWLIPHHETFRTTIQPPYSSTKG
jgi:hypothetical protein